MKLEDRIDELRKEIRQLSADLDPESIADQIKFAATNQRLWIALADDALENSRRAKGKTKAEYVELARRCSAEAKDWAHQGRQAQKLLKVDRLRAIEAKLEHNERQGARFGELLTQRDRAKQLSNVRLEQARGQPAGIRGSETDRGSGSEG